MSRILFITTNFPPDRTVGTQRVTKILKYIDHDRYQFHVLTLKEDYFKEKMESYEKDVRQISDKVKIYRTGKIDLTYFFTNLKAFLNNGSSKKRVQSVNNQGTKNSENQVKSSIWNNRLLLKIRNGLYSIFEFPDKYIGWLPSAVKHGIRIVKDKKIDIIFSTAPPHSLFIIAWLIKKRTGARLALDFRDPWGLSQWDGRGSFRNRMELYFERKVIECSDLVLFVTEHMKQKYLKHYSQNDAKKFFCFSNGFDADDFEGKRAIQIKQDAKKSLQILHLGSLYKKRNPEPLIRAIYNLVQKGKINSEKFQLKFIGFIASELERLPDLIISLGLEKIIKFLPTVSYSESLNEMYQADGLLIVQPLTQTQVPAKIFEYMYTEKPIFALAEPGSATEDLILKGNLGYVAPSTDIQLIEKSFISFLDILNNNKHHPDKDYIRLFDMSLSINQLQQYLEGLKK